MPSEQTDQANIEQWVFKPRSLLVLCWVTVPFFLSTWLVWFAFAWAGRLGWLFGLLSVLCAGIGIAGWKMWQNSRPTAVYAIRQTAFVQTYEFPISARIAARILPHLPSGNPDTRTQNRQ